MAPLHLLVTGFGPFPGMPRNPSGDIARRVAALPCWRIQGVDCRCLVLPTSYAALDQVFAPMLARGFDAVFMIGVAGKSRTVRVESRAANRLSTLLPDASGAQPTKLAGKARAAHRRANVNSAAALAVLRRNRVAARISQDAGRYLCNAGYYQALEQTCPVLFIHIPKPPRRRPPCVAPRKRLGWRDSLAFGFAAVARHMLSRHARLQATRKRQ